MSRGVLLQCWSRDFGWLGWGHLIAPLAGTCHCLSPEKSWWEVVPPALNASSLLASLTRYWSELVIRGYYQDAREGKAHSYAVSYEQRCHSLQPVEEKQNHRELQKEYLSMPFSIANLKNNFVSGIPPSEKNFLEAWAPVFLTVSH